MRKLFDLTALLQRTLFFSFPTFGERGILHYCIATNGFTSQKLTKSPLSYLSFLPQLTCVLKSDIMVKLQLLVSIFWCLHHCDHCFLKTFRRQYYSSALDFLCSNDTCLGHEYWHLNLH